MENEDIKFLNINQNIFFDKDEIEAINNIEDGNYSCLKKKFIKVKKSFTYYFKKLYVGEMKIAFMDYLRSGAFNDMNDGEILVINVRCNFSFKIAKKNKK